MVDSSLNPLLIVRQNLTPHIAELEDRRKRLIAELLEVNHSLALAVTLQQVLPVEPLTEPSTGSPPAPSLVRG